MAELHRFILCTRNEEVGRAVAEKRRALEEWLHSRDRLPYDWYRAQKVVVKRAVKVAKRTADWRWGKGLGIISRVTIRCFGKR